MRQKIIIVDDHELVANGLAKHFSEHALFEVIGVFTNPEEALKRIQLIQPDFVVSDLDMPGMNGLEMLQRVKEISNDIKCILLTMHLSKQLYQKAKQQKIEGYLPKSTDEDELFMCMQQLTKGKSYYSQQLMELISSETTNATSSLPSAKQTQFLSDREREILILVAEGHSTKEIGEKIHLAPKTVETHRKNIMTKLEVKNVAGMVRIAVKEGLLD